MFILKERSRQKYRTLNWPQIEPSLSARYRGRPVLQERDCGQCRKCLDVCPTGALARRAAVPTGTPSLDMGLCIFCGACQKACSNGAFTFTSEYRLATASRADLVVEPGARPNQAPVQKWPIFKRSLKLRQVCAGGCNACEADCNVLSTLVYDLGRFGVEFTASPRHADGLVVTGPVTRAMLPALMDTWQAMPVPRLLYAVGACAISGGLFRTAVECMGGMDGKDHNVTWPVEEMAPAVFIPGCPPNPWTIMAGLLSIR